MPPIWIFWKIQIGRWRAATDARYRLVLCSDK